MAQSHVERAHIKGSKGRSENFFSPFALSRSPAEGELVTRMYVV